MRRSFALPVLALPVLALSAVAPRSDALAGGGGLDISVDAGREWIATRSPNDGALTLRGSDGATVVFRLVHAGDRDAATWFRDGVREAARAGVVVLRDAVERRLGDRAWNEARFRSLAADRTTPRTTIASAADFGPCVIEAYWSAPERASDAQSREFDRLRAALRLVGLAEDANARRAQ